MSVGLDSSMITLFFIVYIGLPISITLLFNSLKILENTTIYLRIILNIIVLIISYLLIQKITDPLNRNLFICEGIATGIILSIVTLKFIIKTLK